MVLPEGVGRVRHDGLRPSPAASLPRVTALPPEPAGLLPSTTARLLPLVARTQRDGRAPSLVAGVVRDGGLAWSCGRGDVPGPPDDVQYRLGSITKPVTAVAVMRLRDEGLLDLDDALEDHLPGTPFGRVTVGQLLAHVAGVGAESPGGWWERTPGGPLEDLALTDADRVLAAGRRFHYSNLGFGLLGQLAARLRGRSWEEVVRDEVLLPLGMTRTTTRPSGAAASGFAVHPWADVVLPEPEHDAGAMAPAGQLWATLADLARFGAFLLGDTGDVLAADTLAEMCVPAGVDPTSAGLVRLRARAAGACAPTGARWSGTAARCRGSSRCCSSTARSRPARCCWPTPPPGSTCRSRPGCSTSSARPSRASSRRGRPLAAAGAARRARPLVLGPVAVRAAGDARRAAAPVRARPRRPGVALPAARRTAAGSGSTATTRARCSRCRRRELRLATFVYTREPYDPAADVPGGVDEGGWR